MKNVTMIWLLTAVPAAAGIAFDMHRLRVNRVGLSSWGWAATCICLSAFAVVPYLILRRRVWRKLIEVVWRFVGDNAHALDVRRDRLQALRTSGLIGEAAFRVCARALDAQHDPTTN
ncbi:hypothetical protein [Paraburkholderia xenovorans]|uniref:Transmembrane protein n=1 Tax=Paraburkholderia xenovorans (strain LB400) TaxID=266265 RepID=Q13ZD1_PARXL|nr:hypothetical protein [Paraburkholderia xenovorans]ABE30558.1 hypothetical protein Bxe_A2411 [Paraburkholderia xenovorans LB400]